MRSIEEIMHKKDALDILLINPPVTKRVFRSELTYIERRYWETMEKIGILWGDHKIEPNYGLLSIAAKLIQNNFKTDLVDFNIIDHYYRDNKKTFLSEQNIEETIKNKNAQAFGISTMTVNFAYAKNIARIIRKHNPNSKIILGGIHATFNAKKIITETDNEFDFIIQGEGEEAIIEILNSKNDQDIEKIPGLVGKINGKIFYNNVRPLIKDLNELPLPAFGLLPKETKPLLTRIYTSRGCSGQCKFCIVNNFFQNKIRFKKPEKIIEEIAIVQEKFKPEMILIGDLTFLDNKKLALELCDLMIKEKIDTPWWCQSRVDKINNECAKKMNKANCHQIALGVESAAELEKNNMNKNISLERTIQACKTIKQNDVQVQTYWMFGLPSDTYASSIKTIELIKKFIKERLTDVTHMGVLVPYPGIECFDEPKTSEIKLLTKDYADFWMNCDDVSSGLPVYRTKNLSEIQIYGLWLRALKDATKEYEKRINEQQKTELLKITAQPILA
jgi:radical SAM superfamily enzyme YgiQ (UPF0313 family)